MIVRVIALVYSLVVVGAVVLADEVPGPDDAWRVHQLARCQRPAPPVLAARAGLDEAMELFALENGGDAAVALESVLRRHPRSPWIRLFLAQIYILAGQGEPHCLPTGGPAAPTGDWPGDRRRCLNRADRLLADLAGTWPEDSLVWFLRADAARALEATDNASEYDWRGRQSCTVLATMDMITGLRDLARKPAELLTTIVPDYPEECARRGVEGEVLLDLLIDPTGRAVQAVSIMRADRRLIVAAESAATEAGFQAARVGYYPVWSWLQVSVRFVIDN